MLQAPEPDDYVDVVHLAAKKYLKHDAALERPTEAGQARGFERKIRRTLDRQPRKGFTDLVREMVEVELAALSRAAR